MKKNDRYTSIVIASYIPDDERARTFRNSIESLLETTKGRPVEIIVVDNGTAPQFQYVSSWTLNRVLAGEIQCYIRNQNNMHFGYARNQGIGSAHGNYIVIADNDIIYQDGWLEACWEILEAHPEEKIYATPIAYPDLPNGKTIHRYDAGEIKVGDKTLKMNMRAGSNCFMIRDTDLFTIGLFRYHRIAGTVWTDMAVRAGYRAVVTAEPLVRDAGLRVGYNHREPLPIFRTLQDGSKVYMNQDEGKYD